VAADGMEPPLGVLKDEAVSGPRLPRAIGAG
jgi:hypothetical protein